MMKHKLTAVLFLTTALTGCQGTDGGSAMETDADTLLKSMAGPEITGVDATMLKMAVSAETKGDYRAAAQTYQQLLDKSPSNAPLAISYAEALRRSGKPDLALEVFKKVLHEVPDNQDAMEGKGLSELSLADLDAASMTLTKLAQINPNRWRTLNAIGILFATRGLYDESVQYFDAALQKKPNHPAVINNKGLVQALDRRFSQSISSLLEASDVAKTSMQKTQIDLNTALVYAVAGDLQNAEVMAAKHLQGAALQNNLGLYASLAKDNELARTHLNMALSESTTFYEKAWDNLNNIQNTKQTKFNGKDISKRIQLNNVSGNASNLPDLPQPGSASGNMSSSNSQQLFANPAPATSLVAAPEENKPTEMNAAIVDSKTDIANQQTLPVAEEVADTPTTENHAQTSNPNDASQTNTNVTAEKDQEPQKTSAPLFNFDFLSRFKPVADDTQSTAAEATKSSGNVNINASSNLEPLTKTTSDTSSVTKSDAVETPKANTEAENSSISNEPATDSSSTATNSKADLEVQKSEAKDTPHGVSKDSVEPSSGNNETTSEKPSDASEAKGSQSNGFKELEDYISNW